MMVRSLSLKPAFGREGVEGLVGTRRELCHELTHASGAGPAGETWTDETGDLATISMGHGRWYESDFYITTQGEGVIAKRNFE